MFKNEIKKLSDVHGKYIETSQPPTSKSSIVDMDKTSLNIVCPEGVIDGCLFTKEKRQELYGKVAGGGGSKKPEDNQKQQIVLGTGRACNTHKLGLIGERMKW